MIDLAIIVVGELLILIAILAALREWWVSRWHRWLLPVSAYLLAMLSCPGSIGDGFLHPWVDSLICVMIGVILHVNTRRAARHREDTVDTERPDTDRTEG